jgi:hypothetical protein
MAQKHANTLTRYCRLINVTCSRDRLHSPGLIQKLEFAVTFTNTFTPACFSSYTEISGLEEQTAHFCVVPRLLHPTDMPSTM